jgi:hypothetical protein
MKRILSFKLIAEMNSVNTLFGHKVCRGTRDSKPLRKQSGAPLCLQY